MSDLVENPEDRFSHDSAHIVAVRVSSNLFHIFNYLGLPINQSQDTLLQLLSFNKFANITRAIGPVSVYFHIKFVFYVALGDSMLV